jgi:hypothetical protein
MANGTLKVSNIETSSGSGTITIGQSGETVTIPSGATVSGAMSNTPYFLVQKTSSQTLSDNASTKITFDSETIDSDSAFASDKFTVPSGKAGKYYLNASVEDYDSDGSIQDRKLYIYKNGSELFRHTLSYTNSGTTDLAMVTANISVTVDASVGDYYEVYYQGNTDDGGSFIVADNAKTTFFQGHKLIT